MTAPKLPSAPSPAGETASEPEHLCMCGHRRGDHMGMGPSRAKPVMSACGACGCQQWRPSKAAVPEPVSTEEAAELEVACPACGRMKCFCCVAAPIAPAAVSAQNEAQNLRYAQQIAEHMAKKFYPEVTQWKPLEGDMFGLITQIDNMITGLMRAKPSAEGDGWIAWDRPPARARRDIVGQRNLLDGRTEYLMHNEALCSPYYVAVSPLPAPPSGQGEVR